MKIDLIKFLTLIWMFAMCYLMFEMSINLEYLTGLIHSYIQMAVDHIKH